MTLSELTSDRLRESLLFACERLKDARQELCSLDAAAGDGDLGATLANGFAAVADRLLAMGNARPGAIFIEVGSELARTAPSTLGTLLAWAHLTAGRALGEI